MNVKIEIEDDVLQQAREAAKLRGVTLEDLIRDQLRELARQRSRSEAADELLRLMSEKGGHSGGKPFRREELYQDRLG